MDPIIQLIIAESPRIIGLIQELFSKKNPGVPVPTSEEITAKFHQAYTDSNVRDEILKAILQAEIDARSGGG